MNADVCCASLQILLNGSVSRQLLRAAPYLTGKQVEHLLRHANVGVTLRQRLKFLLGLKRRVEKVAQGCLEALGIYWFLFHRSLFELKAWLIMACSCCSTL